MLEWSTRDYFLLATIHWIKQRISLLHTGERSWNTYHDAFAARSRQGIPLAHMTKEEAIRARVIYDSAFHPDTGAKMNVLGRMSSQAPCGTLLLAGALSLYRLVHLYTWAIVHVSYYACELLCMWTCLVGVCHNWLSCSLLFSRLPQMSTTQTEMLNHR